MVEESIADVLALLGSGATGPILMALGGGSLRTEQLVRELRHFVPRTVYRHCRRLVDANLVDRHESAGVPSEVTYSLNRPAGRELHRVLNSCGATWMPRTAGAEIQSWVALGALGELWRLGFVASLSEKSQTLSKLARSCDDHTVHQINHRMSKFVALGLLDPDLGSGRGKRYGLTSQARRGMGLVAAIGRWRHHHVVAEGHTGLVPAEVATVLSAMVPLIELRNRQETNLTLVVDADGGRLPGRGAKLVGVRVGSDGSLYCDTAVAAEPRASIHGTPGDWLTALLDGSHDQLRFGGAAALGQAFADGLGRLWKPSEDRLARDAFAAAS